MSSSGKLDGMLAVFSTGLIDSPAIFIVIARALASAHSANTVNLESVTGGLVPVGTSDVLFDLSHLF